MIIRLERSCKHLILYTSISLFKHKMTEAMKPKICRLCLKSASKNYYEMVEKKLVMVNAILVDLNWTISENPIMCCECLEKLQSSYDFKSTCLTTEEDTKTSINGKQSEVDLWQIGYENNQSSSVEHKEVCGFCLKSNMCFNLEEKDDVLLMLQKCVPELDLSTVREHVICQSCFVTLGGMFAFVTSCSSIEETINDYRNSECPSSSDTVDLYNVLRFTETKKERDGGEMSVEGFMDDNEFQNALVKSEDIQDEELQVKSEIWVKDEPLEIEEESENSFKNENFELKTETISRRFEESPVTIKPIVTTGLKLNQLSKIEKLLEPHIKHVFVKKSTKITYQCEHCPFQAKRKHNLKMHTVIHEKPSKVTIHKCDTCTYQTKKLSHLKRHLLRHKDPSEVTMYKCDSCIYQTNRKDTFTSHLRRHIDISDVTMYKHDSCLYQTCKSDFKIHLLKHTEATMHKCDSCSYQSRRMSTLKIHSLKHKSPSEVTIYKCDSCIYQTKRKDSIKSHLRRHMDISEVTMYKCDSCEYQSKYKSNLKMHLLKHKSLSDVTIYKCDSCSYQAKQMSSLKSHLLIHKDPSEITMYKCDSCLYQTKCKSVLKIHLLKHKSPSEAAMHKCDSCSYQSNRRSNLKMHLLKHKSPSEVTIYKCDSCIYQTKRKDNFRSHLRRHMDISEVTMYKCDSCAYQTRNKHVLKVHLLKHQSPSKATVHKCDSCSFETKYMSCFRRHLLRHNKSFRISNT